MPRVGTKRRVLVGSRSEWGVETGESMVTASPTGLPAFPTGPDANGHLVFAGDMKGACIVGARWELSGLTTFTAADVTLQHSPDGTNWTNVDGGGFTQKTADGSESITFNDDDSENSFRYWRALVDMTGTPGSAANFVELVFLQKGPAGKLAPPGQHDVNH